MIANNMKKVNKKTKKSMDKKSMLILLAFS